MKPYELVLRVQYFDTDKMQVVHHANYIKYFETARTEYLRDNGFAYSEMEKYDFQIPVLGVNVKYHEPAVYDELVVVSCRMSKLGFASMELEYEVRNKETGVLHVTGSTRHGMVDSDYRPVVLKKKCPQAYEFLQKLYEQDKTVDEVK